MDPAEEQPLSGQHRRKFLEASSAALLGARAAVGIASAQDFFPGGKARTADLNPGDVGNIPKTLGHYIENTGNTDLVFLEMFKSTRFQDLSLSDWVTHTPPRAGDAAFGNQRRKAAGYTA